MRRRDDGRVPATLGRHAMWPEEGCWDMDRKEMTRVLEEWMGHGYAGFRETGRLPRGRNPLKSYLLEANVTRDEEQRDSVAAFFAQADLPIPVEMTATDDLTLHVLHIGQRRVPFFLDTSIPASGFCIRPPPLMRSIAPSAPSSSAPAALMQPGFRRASSSAGLARWECRGC